MMRRPVVSRITLFVFSFLLLPTLNRCTIQIPALGTFVSLGTLYDIRTSEFGSTVFVDDVPSNAVALISTPQLKSETRLITTLEEKCSLISLELSVCLDVLSGLVSVTGPAEYLMEKYDTRKYIEISHFRSLFTKREELKLYVHNLKRIYSLDVLNSTNATHMVTGIQWGAIDLVIFLQTIDDYISAEEIQEALKIEIPEITLNTTRKLENIAFKLHADLNLNYTILPQSFEDLKMYLANMSNPLMQSNGGKGKPLLYKLTPLSQIRSQLRQELRAEIYKESIVTSGLNSFVNVFQEIDDHKLLLQSYEELFTQEFIPIGYSVTLALHQTNFTMLATDYKDKVKQFLIASRSKNETVTNAEVEGARNAINEAITGLVFPDLQFKKMLFANFVVAGIPYFGRNNFLERYLFSHRRSFCLLLPKNFTASRNEQFIERYLHFLNDLHSVKVVVDCEFEHSVCLGKTVRNGLILEYKNARIVNSDVKSISNKSNETWPRNTTQLFQNPSISGANQNTSLWALVRDTRTSTRPAPANTNHTGLNTTQNYMQHSEITYSRTILEEPADHQPDIPQRERLDAKRLQHVSYIQNVQKEFTRQLESEKKDFENKNRLLRGTWKSRSATESSTMQNDSVPAYSWRTLSTTPVTNYRHTTESLTVYETTAANLYEGRSDRQSEFTLQNILQRRMEARRLKAELDKKKMEEEFTRQLESQRQEIDDEDRLRELQTENELQGIEQSRIKTTELTREFETKLNETAKLKQIFAMCQFPTFSCLRELSMLQ